MLEAYPLITTIVISIVCAFLLGFIINRLYLPTILGYLLAGILLGPYTQGLVVNADIARQLAEIGVILLMFGVGMHFSTNDLIKVHHIALPGAIIQMLVTTTICFLIMVFMKYNFMESLVFGLALSVSSTVVLLRTFEQYQMIHTNIAKIAVGWLIVEDIVMIIVLVVLPVVSNVFFNSKELNYYNIASEVILIIFKIATFIVLMMIFGKKLLPKLLIAISRTNSRELMSLGILAISSGFAFIAYNLFGTSFALGAFMAGFVLNESKIGKKSVEESLPLRDIFSVLFFISVGMLFDPKILIKEPFLILAAFLFVIFGKAIIAYLVMKLFKQGIYQSLILAVSLAQIGEFSFILAALGLELNIFSPTLYDMVIASAIISITINPFLFNLVKRFKHVD